MFEQLMELVRESGQKTVVENPEVPNEHNEAVMQEATTSIQNGMQQIARTGGPGALKTLFQGVESGDHNNPQMQQLTNNVSGDLMQKLGLNSGIAKTIAISLIPMVLGKLMGRSRGAEQGSGFSMGNILGSLLGGGSLANMIPGMGGGGSTQQQSGGGGMLSNMGSKLGLDRDGDGDTDLQDLMGMFRK
jgi:hypothetical protein